LVRPIYLVTVRFFGRFLILAPKFFFFIGTSAVGFRYKKLSAPIGSICRKNLSSLSRLEVGQIGDTVDKKKYNVLLYTVFSLYFIMGNIKKNFYGHSRFGRPPCLLAI